MTVEVIFVPFSKMFLIQAVNTPNAVIIVGIFADTKTQAQHYDVRFSRDRREKSGGGLTTLAIR